MDNIVYDSYRRFGRYLDKFFKGNKILIVTDKIVEEIYIDSFLESISDRDVYTYSIEPGESSKSYHSYISICEYLMENEFTREDVVVALGGGVVGDLSGFVAGTYQRGMKFVQVPTTLLSQVDSSVGAKTAINLLSAKNQIGVFYDADLVLVDHSFLDTLSEDIFFDGFAEVIKYSVIEKSLDRNLYLNRDYSRELDYDAIEEVEVEPEIHIDLDRPNTGANQDIYVDIETDGVEVEHGNNIGVDAVIGSMPIDSLLNGYYSLYDMICDKESLKDNLPNIVKICIDIKKKFVEIDRTDKGVRRILNFGHTVGHGIEVASGYSISHGYAVAKGMYYIAKLSESMGVCTHSDFKKLEYVLRLYGYDLDMIYKDDKSLDTIKIAIRHDKKRVSDSINVVLMESIGRCRVEEIMIDDIF